MQCHNALTDNGFLKCFRSHIVISSIRMMLFFLMNDCAFQDCSLHTQSYYCHLLPIYLLTCEILLLFLNISQFSFQYPFSNFPELVADIKLRMCVYFQKTIKYINSNIKYLVIVLNSTKIYVKKGFHVTIIFFISHFRPHF